MEENGKEEASKNSHLYSRKRSGKRIFCVFLCVCVESISWEILEQIFSLSVDYHMKELILKKLKRRWGDKQANRGNDLKTQCWYVVWASATLQRRRVFAGETQYGFNHKQLRLVIYLIEIPINSVISKQFSI